VRSRSKRLLPFQFIYIGGIRDYLEYEFSVKERKIDLEKTIDDFILICILCGKKIIKSLGNDFLPSIPSLKIEDDSIDILLDVYEQFLKLNLGYISNK
jgi:5'-3' exonuclease